MIALGDIRQMMTGTWQSLDDPNFTREFAADGAVTDRYAGDGSATVTGRWILFSGSRPPAGLAIDGLNPSAVYLELRQQGDVLLFGLVYADHAALQMIYLSRGNTLNFSRLK